MSIKPSDIKRGEIWRVNFDPTIGTEIKKTRPAVVISSNSLGKLPIKLIAPITGWDASYENSIWHTKIQPDSRNNLTKTSSIDALQIRGVDILRFVPPKMGVLSQDRIDEISASIAAIIELQ